MAACFLPTNLNAFVQGKYIKCDYDFNEVCSQGSNYQYYIIGSDNGLLPVRRQAIIWANDGYWWLLVRITYMRHSAPIS